MQRYAKNPYCHELFFTPVSTTQFIAMAFKDITLISMAIKTPFVFHSQQMSCMQ